ncbi:uncharacterized protein L969DRAFT_42155 [Mixia osmundae IAM 14324]|uniref:PX domain-containing protein n=1 Tax=Mixia osmundae (strain CBS 9802 / IAM 14324 / JCM 22182 / KY 12970) TaxID=764103 RepID=G7DTE0_MIXOS|nr:uncharacterized protein L969DRAFT_42155 [Mixia osmundae IAM 14324]KEI42875.1 hypothetical protein L969DRAFT_42155 [Mixia osmundae IAM 14324]GAA93787.1 hypothetical protein E5Q_00433 [Mixia osmundae IAM 14324]
MPFSASSSGETDTDSAPDLETSDTSSVMSSSADDYASDTDTYSTDASLSETTGTSTSRSTSDDGSGSSSHASSRTTSEESFGSSDDDSSASSVVAPNVLLEDTKHVSYDRSSFEDDDGVSPKQVAHDRVRAIRRSFIVTNWRWPRQRLSSSDAHMSPLSSQTVLPQTRTGRRGSISLYYESIKVKYLVKDESSKWHFVLLISPKAASASPKFAKELAQTQDGLVSAIPEEGLAADEPPRLELSPGVLTSLSLLSDGLLPGQEAVTRRKSRWSILDEMSFRRASAVSTVPLPASHSASSSIYAPSTNLAQLSGSHLSTITSDSLDSGQLSSLPSASSAGSNQSSLPVEFLIWRKWEELQLMSANLIAAAAGEGKKITQGLPALKKKMSVFMSHSTMVQRRAEVNTYLEDVLRSPFADHPILHEFLTMRPDGHDTVATEEAISRLVRRAALCAQSDAKLRAPLAGTGGQSADDAPIVKRVSSTSSHEHARQTSFSSSGTNSITASVISGTSWTSQPNQPLSIGTTPATLAGSVRSGNSSVASSPRAILRPIETATVRTLPPLPNDIEVDQDDWSRHSRKTTISSFSSDEGSSGSPSSPVPSLASHDRHTHQALFEAALATASVEQHTPCPSGPPTPRRDRAESERSRQSPHAMAAPEPEKKMGLRSVRSFGDVRRAWRNSPPPALPPNAIAVSLPPSKSSSPRGLPRAPLPSPKAPPPVSRRPLRTSLGSISPEPRGSSDRRSSFQSSRPSSELPSGRARSYSSVPLRREAFILPPPEEVSKLLASPDEARCKSQFPPPSTASDVSTTSPVSSARLSQRFSSSSSAVNTPRSSTQSSPSIASSSRPFARQSLDIGSPAAACSTTSFIPPSTPSTSYFDQMGSKYYVDHAGALVANNTVPVHCFPTPPISSILTPAPLSKGTRSRAGSAARPSLDTITASPPVTQVSHTMSTLSAEDFAAAIAHRQMVSSSSLSCNLPLSIDEQAAPVEYLTMKILQDAGNIVMRVPRTCRLRDVKARAELKFADAGIQLSSAQVGKTTSSGWSLAVSHASRGPVKGSAAIRTEADWQRTKLDLGSKATFRILPC